MRINSITETRPNAVAEPPRTSGLVPINRSKSLTIIGGDVFEALRNEWNEHPYDMSKVKAL